MSNSGSRFGNYLLKTTLCLMVPGISALAQNASSIRNNSLSHTRSGAAPSTPERSSSITTAAASAVIRRFQLSTNDIVYDPVGQMLYASVPSRFGETGNCVVPIDPKTLRVGPPIWVGSEPGKMAVSDDGKYLYLALDGAKAVRRVDLNSQSVGLQFWLGNHLTRGAVIPTIGGPYYAVDLKAIPGRSDSVAVLSHGPTIYRDESELPIDLGPVDYYSTYGLAFSDSASTLYGTRSEE